jgi:hypothetical protein
MLRSPDAPKAVGTYRHQSYNRHNHRIASQLGTLCVNYPESPAIGGVERDVVEAEFPKRPPAPGETDWRPLTDYRSPPPYPPPRAAEGRVGAPVRLAGSDVGARNRFDVRKHYEVAMNTGTNVNLRKLQEQLDRQPLDEIAMLVQALTYGEMIELAEGMWKVQPDGSAVTQENLPALLHRWSKSRSLPADDVRQDPDAV